MKMLRNKKALSTVITTLIILVVSVLLATVVTFYAINVTTTRVQEESLQITKMHVWCTNEGDASAAFMITNTGGRDTVIDKITVRGKESDLGNVYYWKVNETDGDTVPSDLDWVDDAPNLNTTYEDEHAEFFSASSLDALTLRSGARMVIYIYNLDHLSTSDIGISIGVVVFTANAQYHKEANVEAVIPS
ncbi:MAG: hypothetical protein ACPLRY_03535 [Candidatus Bathyarchaeales archaeon]